MGRKKNPEKKTTAEKIVEALQKEDAKIRSARQSAFEAPSETLSAREQFRAFWAVQKKNYKKTKDIEDILWAHLESSGHAKPELFEKGIEHFGLKK